MARHNIVSVYGMVSGEPNIIKDRDTGEFKKGIMSIILVRGYRDAGYEEDALRYDWPMVFSGKPEIIEKMSKLHEFDVVEIKGFLTTLDISKKTTCKACGNSNSVKGSMAFISPLYFDIRRTDSTERESLIDLKEHMEISNQCLLIGNLCGDVAYYHDRKVRTASYQLAVNRKFYLDDGQPNVRTDYPFILSCGENAVQDAQALHKGSLVLVDGRIQTRKYNRGMVCAHCGTEYSWEDNTIEVIPYSVEYLQDFLSQEEIAEKEREELLRAKQQIFS